MATLAPAAIESEEAPKPTRRRRGEPADLDIPRLCDAIQNSRSTLEYARRCRREAVAQYAGNRYSETSAERTVFVNLVAKYVQVVVLNLVAKDPRAMLSTHNREAKPAVAAVESWMNRQVVRMRLSETLSEWATDSLFGLGVLKVALTTPAAAAEAGYGFKAGEPYCEVVSFEDFVFDHHARSLRTAGFLGHRLRLPLKAVKDSPLYNKEVTRDLVASDDPRYHEDGDERTSHMARGDSDYLRDEYEDHVDLWEVYLPRHKAVVTLACDADGGPARGKAPLRVAPWVGPPCGPYFFLDFDRVPDNPLPKARVNDLIDLHESVNRIFRKLIRQAERQKEHLLFHGTAEQDAKRINDSPDGSAVHVDRPDGIKVATWGGPNPGNFNLFIALKDLFSWLAGNLDALGGLSAQAKTAKQEQMLGSASAKSVQDMAGTFVSRVTEVLTALAWYWWHDPYKVMRTTFKMPGLDDIQIDRAVHPYATPGPAGQLNRDIPFEELDLKVDPYSMGHTTPQERAQQLTGIMTQVIQPMLPLLQQAGVTVDLNAFLTKLSKYHDLPDLTEIVTVTEPPQVEGPTAGQEMPGPGSTSREYVRRSLGQDTEANRTNDMLGAMGAAGDGMMNTQQQGGGGVR